MQKPLFSLIALLILTVTLTASALTTVSITPATIASPEIGQQLEVQVKISGGRSIAGYQLTLVYDKTTLAYVNIKVGDYLPPEAFLIPPVSSPGSVMVGAVAISGVAKKTDGILALATFKVLAKKDSTIQLSEVRLSNREAQEIPAVIKNGNVLESRDLADPLNLEATDAPLDTGNLGNTVLESLDKPLDLTNAAVISVEPAKIGLPEVGQQIRIRIKIADGRNVAGYQLKLAYDKTVLEYINIKNGDYLPEDFAKVFDVEPVVSPGSVLYGAAAIGNVAKVADGTLATATFKVLSRKDSAIRLSEVLLSDGNAQEIAVTTQGGQVTGKAAPRKPVITERVDGGKSLNVNTVITTNGLPVTALTPIYQEKTGITAKAGTLIEYQVKFSQLSVLKSGGVYVHTADGIVLGTTDVIQGMRHQEATTSGWSHHQIALDPIASKKIVAITVGTRVESAPKGLFSMLVDNIQLTDGNTIIKPIWLSRDRATEVVKGEIYGKLVGVDQLNLGIANDEVAVYPQGKVLTSWGRIKSYQ